MGLVADISDGLVRKWNMENPALMVQTGDRIIRINRVHRDAKLMIAECRKKIVLEMVIRGIGRKRREAGKVPTSEHMTCAAIGGFEWHSLTVTREEAEDLE